MRRYYPLIDMDSTGTIKVPMIPTNDYKKAFRSSNFALEEVSSNHYRLIAIIENAMREYLFYDIRCPKCGATMDLTEPRQGEYILAGYTCTNCK